jgi:hypothetical protein
MEMEVAECQKKLAVEIDQVCFSFIYKILFIALYVTRI